MPNTALALLDTEPAIAVKGRDASLAACLVDRGFPFGEVPDTYRYFDSRTHFGKVVISHG
jgi:hypothetical protein